VPSSTLPGLFGQDRGEGGRQIDGLGDVAVGGRGADAEACRKLGIGVAVAEAGEGEQRLPAGAHAPSGGAKCPAVFSQASGQEAQGGVGQVQPGRVDKHAKSLVEPVLLGRKPTLLVGSLVGREAMLSGFLVRRMSVKAVR
jgi:hypothetical protein